MLRPISPRLLVSLLGAWLALASALVAEPAVSQRAPVAGTTVNALTQISVTFSEAVAGVDASDLLIDGEPAGGVTGSAAGPYVFTFTEPPPGQVSVDWDFDHGIAGLGTGAFVPAGWIYTLTDSIAPTIGKIKTLVAGQELDAIVPLPTSTVGSLTQTEVTFSEEVTGVDPADLRVNGVAATGVTGSDAGPYVFTFAQPAAGTVTFSWLAGHGIVDAAANPFGGGSWTVTRSASGAGTVTINEFLAANASGLTDENGDNSDWIELYNPGPGAVSLAGWSLSDDAEVPGKWVLPARTLAANGYLVIFASSKDRRPTSGNLHTNFTLGAGGGSLFLSSPESPRGPVSSFVDFPDQRYNYSFGPQTGGALRYFQTPTPGAANGASSLATVASEPRMSVSRGYFQDPFQLVLSCADPGATIRYTLDGSEPLASSPAYTAPLNITGTTILRAAAFSATTVPSVTVTQSYLFLDQVLTQPGPPYNNPSRGDDDANPALPTVGSATMPITWGTRASVGFPGLVPNLNANEVPADYGMDPEIVNDPSKYLDTGAINPSTGKLNLDRIKQGLRDLPILSVVLNNTDMFGATTGIYVAPYVLQKTPLLEKACSVELLMPDGSTGFASTCGIRIHGNASRSPESNPKHGFKLNFKGSYGASSLAYALFPDSPVEEFDDIILRADYNSHWCHWDGPTQRPKGTRVRDAFAKDTFRDMGRMAGHNRLVNLFINGIYWGTYDPAEQENNGFAAAYFGGDKDDYDVIDQGALKSGTFTAYNAMKTILGWTGTSSATTTQNTGPAAGLPAITNTEYESVKQYLDVPWFIDYMILHYWEGHQDWGTETNYNKNWYAVRRHTPAGTFKYLPWDQENLLWATTDNRVTTALYPPTAIHPRLNTNPQYRLDFADFVHKHMVAPDGALQPAANIARWNKWQAIMTNAIACESARWGDYRRDVHQRSSAPYDLYTWQGAYITEVNRLKNSYFPVRTSTVVGQFRTAGLYPTLNAPEFRDNTTNALIGAQSVAAGFALKMNLVSPAPGGTTSAGTIYYTTDGADPRVYYDTTGARTPNAVAYAAPIVINQTATVKARALNGTTWSALMEAKFSVGFTPQPVRITEIMYHPANANGGDAAEFVELQNTSDTDVNIGLWSFDGIEFIFPTGSILGAGARLVLASNNAPATFAAQYPGVTVAGYFGGTLANGGERLALKDANGRTIVSVEYSDVAPWPTAPDGDGPSLEIIDPNGDPDSPVNWKASNAVKGTPGQANSAPPASAVVINEVVAENAGGALVGGQPYDYIELKNTGGAPIDLLGWNVSTSTLSFTFASSLVVPAGSFVVVPCHAAAPTPRLPGALPAAGDFVRLRDASGMQVDAVQFGNQVPNFGIGRVGAAWVLTTPTVGANNSAAALAPPAGNLVLNEWLANAVAGSLDWIELFNKHATLPVALQGLSFQTDTQIYRYPALAFLGPQGRLQLFASEAPGANQLDFTLPAGGTTLAILDEAGATIDALSSAAFGTTPEGVSRGRNPDGSATIVTFTESSSPGGPNYVSSGTGLVVNEVVARNASGAPAPWGEFSDWLEIYNPTASPVSLAGMKLGGTNDPATAWTIPAGVSVPALGYLAVWCEPLLPPSENNETHLNTGIELGEASGALYLFNSADQIVDQVEWGFQLVDRAIGLDAGAWKLLATPTRGAANSGPATLSPPAQLRINEWMAAPAGGNDWFELHNLDANPVALAGLYLTDDPSEAGRSKFLIAPLSFIAGQGWVRFEATNAPAQGRNHVNFTLPASAGTIRLSATDLTPLDVVSYGLQSVGVSQGRILDGAANIVAMPGSPTPAAKNVLLPAPTMGTHPQGQTVTQGVNVNFTAAASGSAPLTYQWRFNGADIPGATNATLSLSGVTGAHDGSYTCVAKNTAGSATSTPAALIVQQTFAQWATGKNLNGAEAAANADPDFDSLNNTLEFFLNLNPLASYTALEKALALPVGGMETIAGTRYLTLTYRQSARALPGSVQHQISTALVAGSWSNVTPAITEPLGPDPLTGDPRVRVKVPLVPTDERKFLRLEVLP